MEKSCVYGPVKSWRFGNSLGIDPIVKTSTCSYNCVYCQLGYIQNITSKREEFVNIEKFKANLKSVDWPNIDVITFSGSGEPTLASNFKQMVELTHKLTKTHNIPIHLLTNSTHLHESDVQEALIYFDEICCKLDSVDESKWQKINRPAKGVNLKSILENIKNIAKIHPHKTTLQIAVLPNSNHDIDNLAHQINLINPKMIYLNRPKRPYPQKWQLEYRGAHKEKSDDTHNQGKSLVRVTNEQIKHLHQQLRKKCKIEIQIN